MVTLTLYKENQHLIVILLLGNMIVDIAVCVITKIKI